MLKNITLSAEAKLIKKAREKASREHTTLNATFRQWLSQYINKNTKIADLSMGTLKPASRGQFKTGHPSGVRLY
ncbi:MAG: hypothetical protein JXI43_06735 [Tissierellales bacterium]|nr:hypothetical protein [Tissierellales bacterium]